MSVFSKLRYLSLAKWTMTMGRNHLFARTLFADSMLTRPKQHWTILVLRICDVDFQIFLFRSLEVFGWDPALNLLVLNANGLIAPDQPPWITTVAGEMTIFSFQQDVINHLALVGGRSYERVFLGRSKQSFSIWKYSRSFERYWDWCICSSCIPPPAPNHQVFNE